VSPIAPESTRLSRLYKYLTTQKDLASAGHSSPLTSTSAKSCTSDGPRRAEFVTTKEESLEIGTTIPERLTPVQSTSSNLLDNFLPTKEKGTLTPIAPLTSTETRRPEASWKSNFPYSGN